MRSRSLILAAGLVSALLVFAGVVYAYDQTRADRVSDGVTVSGVDIGGLSRSAAVAKLRTSLLEPLSQPVRVQHRGRTFTLTTQAAGVGIDLEGSVDRAVAASRTGNLITRAFRNITGGRVTRAVTVDVAYSELAIKQLIRRIERSVERRALNAHVNLEEGDVTPRPSRNGLRVRVERLRRDIVARLTSTSGPRSVVVRTGVVRPKVTTAKLGAKYPAIVIVDRNKFTLTLYKNLEVAKRYRIAVGQAGLETPAGLYTIQNKAVNPSWHVPDSDWAGKLRGKVIPPGDPRNPIEARWMGIYDGAGIHGTTAENSIGTAASHGCIRMRIPDVIDLYDRVETGAPVYIA